jgi:hypothetical protein
MKVTMVTPLNLKLCTSCGYGGSKLPAMETMVGHMWWEEWCCEIAGDNDDNSEIITLTLFQFFLIFTDNLQEMHYKLITYMTNGFTRYMMMMTMMMMMTRIIITIMIMMKIIIMRIIIIIIADAC